MKVSEEASAIEGNAILRRQGALWQKKIMQARTMHLDEAEDFGQRAGRCREFCPAGALARNAVELDGERRFCVLRHTQVVSSHRTHSPAGQAGRGLQNCFWHSLATGLIHLPGKP